MDIASFEALAAYVRLQLAQYDWKFEDSQLHVKPYGYDERLDWDTHIVTLDGYGVVGFTDGPATSAEG